MGRMGLSWPVVAGRGLLVLTVEASALHTLRAMRSVLGSRLLSLSRVFPTSIPPYPRSPWAASRLRCRARPRPRGPQGQHGDHLADPQQPGGAHLHYKRSTPTWWRPSRPWRSSPRRTATRGSGRRAIWRRSCGTRGTASRGGRKALSRRRDRRRRASGPAARISRGGGRTIFSGA